MLAINYLPASYISATPTPSKRIIEEHRIIKQPQLLTQEIKNVIITPSRFYQQAAKLAQFHSQHNMPTIVINTTWISEMYSDLRNPSFYGYANRLIPRLYLRNYDYRLAQKISAYLRDIPRHPNLEYVTLLGNGNFIPPSYYIYAPGRMIKYLLRMIPVPDMYNNIIATDFFYMSPDYDLKPEYKVGRLSVADEQEAITVVDKILRWSMNTDWSWFNNIHVAGDQPNLPEEMNLTGCYAGEMIAVDAINHNYFTNMTITKHFYTDNSFTKQSILSALQYGNIGFFYMMAHGFVDRWGTYNEPDPYIYAQDLMNLSANDKTPIVVSVACMCGAYDTHQAIPYSLPRGTKSLGETILISQGAGIAYVGTSRATLGSPLLYLDEGQVVITQERGIAAMLTYFFDAYHNGTHILGDLVFTAIERYLDQYSFQNHPEHHEAFIVLMSFLLLGDPALELPVYIPNYLANLPYQQPDITAVNPDGYTIEEYSRPWFYTNSEITLLVETDSPSINIKLIDIDRDQVVHKDVSYPIDNNTFIYTFVSYEPTQYLFRAETLDGKESWFYLTTYKKEGDIVQKTPLFLSRK
ncbi:MAG: C25 family cysteine peptidase [Candidatus Thermoplasmatota archaeon]